MSGRLLVFNPGHEEALRIPLGQSYTPPREVRQMMQDLSELMLLLAEPGDYVWLPRAQGFVQVIDHLGRSVDQPRLLPELLLTPWAIEPHLLERISREATDLGLRLRLPRLSSAYLELSHRRSATSLLAYLDEYGVPCAHLSPIWIAPTDLAHAEIVRAIELLGIGSSLRDLIVKRPYTSSGRGVQRLSPPVAEARLRQLTTVCLRSDGISLEPRLEVLQDWAAEYHCCAGEVHYVGLSKFVNHHGSQGYAGNLLESEAALEHELAEQIGKEYLAKVIEGHSRFLASRLADSYDGYIGIDMMLYLDEQREIRLHPAVEINARCTMGVLAQRAYQRYFTPQRQGLYRLLYAPRPQVYELYSEHLACPKDYIPLTHPDPEATYYAYLAASSSQD